MARGETVTRTYSKELESTAYHEAGHAVIGHALGIPFAYVTIEPDHDSAGHIIAADPYSIMEIWEERGKYRDASSASKAKIIGLMAGAETERVLLNLSPVGDEDDRDQIADLVEHGYFIVADDDWPRIEARLRSHTQRLIRYHRQRIKRSAEALLENGSLTFENVEAFFQ